MAEKPNLLCFVWKGYKLGSKAPHPAESKALILIQQKTPKNDHCGDCNQHFGATQFCIISFVPPWGLPVFMSFRDPRSTCFFLDLQLWSQSSLPREVSKNDGNPRDDQG